MKWYFTGKSAFSSKNIKIFKAMKKIEEKTCIKFEDRKQNNHQAWVSSTLSVQHESFYMLTPCYRFKARCLQNLRQGLYRISPWI